MKEAKPFLKWAGGKTQLISEIAGLLPYQVRSSKFTYIEPFAGSGALLFWMLNNFPKMEKAVINDVNADLINVYRVIASKPNELISILSELQADFHRLESKPEKKTEYYYARRTQYNTRADSKSTQAALFIFLNRTCFNGLYRVNKSNLYNVPMGSYKKPTICDAPNIQAVSKALQKVEILCGDYQQTLECTNRNSFFYFDPPYKPLNATSSFTSYAKDNFDDSEQIRLKNFCTTLDDKGHKWLLSNSDVKDADADSSFFDDIYASFYISRVQASRNINSKAGGRGKLNELLITNYNYEQTLQTA